MARTELVAATLERLRCIVLTKPLKLSSSARPHEYLWRMIRQFAGAAGHRPHHRGLATLQTQGVSHFVTGRCAGGFDRVGLQPDDLSLLAAQITDQFSFRVAGRQSLTNDAAQPTRARRLEDVIVKREKEPCAMAQSGE